MKEMYHANHNGAHWVTQTWPSKMRSNTQRDINTRPDQEHVDQLCLSDPEWPMIVAFQLVGQRSLVYNRTYVYPGDCGKQHDPGCRKKQGQRQNKSRYKNR
nr:hypothetical protein BaRGS_022952 [Batillaria attramentaria]